MAISSFVPCPWPRRITALLLFLHAGAEIDAVHPVDVALGREEARRAALRPQPPRPLQPGDRGGRESPGAELPRSAAKASPKSPEMPFSTAWQKVFQALGAAQIARQDRRREADGAVPPVPHTGLAHAHRADPGLERSGRYPLRTTRPPAASTSAAWLGAASTAWANRASSSVGRRSAPDMDKSAAAD